jgi:hypothetical protein
MPSPGRESQPPEDIATQITTGAWLVAASGGLITARAGGVPQDTERLALTALRDALRSAADHESIVAISSQLGLVSAREATYLIDAVGADAAPALSEMAQVLSRASEGVLEPGDEHGIDRVRQLLLSLSELRLAQARNVDRSDPAEPWWPTTLSSVS